MGKLNVKSASGPELQKVSGETRQRVHIEDGPKRVRTYPGGELIADVRMELLIPNGSR